MVLGVPDALWGKAVAALVTTGAGFDAATVRAGFKANLAPPTNCRVSCSQSKKSPATPAAREITGGVGK